jgi:hypothetical protein
MAKRYDLLPGDRVKSPEQLWEMLDGLSRSILGVSADEFAANYKLGRYDHTPSARDLAVLLQSSRKAASDKIAAASTWIPINEGMPEEGARVLILENGDWSSGYFEGGHWYDQLDRSMRSEAKPTHWARVSLLPEEPPADG